MDPLSQVTLAAWSCFPCFTVAQVLRFRSCTVIECTSAFDSDMTIRMPFHSFCLEENHTLVVPLAGHGHGVAGLQLVLHILLFSPDMEGILDLTWPTSQPAATMAQGGR